AGVSDLRAISISGEWLAVISPRQLLLSNNRGESWMPIALPSYVTALHSVTHAAGSLWLATREGALRSFDHGESWEHVLSGLPHRNLLSITFDAKGRRLLATSAEKQEIHENRHN